MNGNPIIDPTQQRTGNYELSMSAMYGQSSLQPGNGQLPSHLLSNNNSSSSSTANGSNELSNGNNMNNGLMDANGHLLVEPKQEPDINLQLMQL